MSSEDGGGSSGYWYEGRESFSSVEVLNLLRRYRTEEGAMRARTRDSMGMGETDLLTLRFLLKSQREGKVVLQRDIVAFLGISSASVTALVDRLVKGNHVERHPHPKDRRATIILATEESEHEVRETLGAMHQRMINIVDDLEQSELDAVAKFLTGMISAVGESKSLDEELRDVIREDKAAKQERDGD
jgi:DNA-binding MarR family transcriptional regulator